MIVHSLASPLSARDKYRYSDAVREATNAAGVYVITQRDGQEILYVGQSGYDLYRTLTRHFQEWTNKYGTAGVVYQPEDCLVALAILEDEDEIDSIQLEKALTCVLNPTDVRYTPDCPTYDDDDEALAILASDIETYEWVIDSMGLPDIPF